MRGSRIPSAKRVINAVAPLNPADLSEANALHLMFLWDNMGTGEYLEDASILLRHLRQLFAREQAAPNLTLEVITGIAWTSTTSYMNFPGGNSPTFTAPAVNPRRDLLVLRNDGSATGILVRIAGTEAVSPVAPTPQSTDIPLCQVFNRVGQTRIKDNDNQEAGQGYIESDIRSFLQVPVGGSAMPKLGIVARTQATLNGVASTDSGYVNVINFAGAGRVNSIHQSIVNAGSGFIYFRIIADGITVFDSGPLNPGPLEREVLKNNPNLLAGFKFVTQTAVPAGDNPKGVDLFFFKQSLQIQHRIDGGPGTQYDSITTVDWEHE